MKKNYFLAFIFLFIVVFVNSQVTYTGKPMYKIDVKRAGTFLGSITVELFPNIAYHHTRNFDSLVSVQFFDTTVFHRVMPGFMIQGGDPNSRHGPVLSWGQGQSGQPTVNAEFSAAKHLRGILSAARAPSINSATSQFFICVAAAPQLNNQYSVYGRATSGMNWVDTIVNAATTTNTLNRPNIRHEMYITAIGSNDTIPKAPILLAPLNGIDTADSKAALLMKWANVKDGIIYTMQVSDDPAFSNIIKTTETGNLTYYITSGLIPETKYYWRVRTNNGGHFSPWSTEWDFKTAALPPVNAVGIASNGSVSGKISVFPNPSSGAFTFSNLEKGAKIEVFDVAGKRVFETNTKDNSILIDLEGKSKGGYTYKIHSGKKITEGKLLLQ